MSWVVLAALSVVAWGFVGLLQKMSSTLLDPAALLFWVIIGLLGGSTPLLVWLPPDAHLKLSISVLLLGLCSGLMNALGSWFLFRALKRGGPAAVVIPLTALYPLITIFVALAFLGETLDLRQAAGALLAVGGGALLSYEPPTPKTNVPLT